MELLQDKKINDLEGLLRKIKPFLRRYLEERNVNIDSKGLFSCINPTHEDKHPSCRFVRNSNEEIFLCFGCGAKGSILHATYLLEGKPISGQGFITDNVLYLAEKYGIPYNTLKLTE